MSLSERFLNFVRQQLISFEADPEIGQLVVYVAQSKNSDSPTFEVVGQFPDCGKVLQPVETDPELSVPSPNRRWYPLQEGSILLGVLRAERIPSSNCWPDSLEQRLQITSSSLAHCLALELDRSRLLNELNEQKEQIGLMVHQLRNPLAALRTYAQLLLRRIGPDNDQRPLIEGLLTEQAQLNRYLSALDDLSEAQLPSNSAGQTSWLLPPKLPQASSDIDLRSLLDPLIERAAATASLQERHWLGPIKWPAWMEESRPASEALIAEIVANLLENAFKYSPKGSSVGLLFNETGFCVWDEGLPIPEEEGKRIFEKGFRGSSGSDFAGTGLGLALGKELAEQLEGNLKLISSPAEFDQSLPKKGNAFIFTRKEVLLKEKKV